jgi:putative OPT family oligopeptide transporter
MDRENFPSYIPADKEIPELTVRAVLVGIFLAIVLGAANAYLGLYAGMTVSAIIPGAVIALGILRPFKPTILEVNIATMGASAGECIAAGVIFTIPALLLLGVWSDINYLQTTIISLIGGMLGVFWMVPLRRALVVKTDLPFPEGIAVAAVLTTTVGGRTSKSKTSRLSGSWLVIGVTIAALFKFAQLTLNLFRETVDGIVSIGKYDIVGNLKESYLYGGTATSPALAAVGWIIGPQISSYVLVGGLIGWVIIAPLMILSSGLPAPLPEYQGLGQLIGGFYTLWGNQVRYIGVGTMLIGGLWAVYSIRSNLVESVREAVIGIRTGGGPAKKRTEQDLSYKLVFVAIGLLVIPTFFLYQWLSGLTLVSLIMAILTVFLAFIASALAGYLTGLVGSSNCPISGVTVTVLLIVSLLLFALGVRGGNGIAIAIFICAVVSIGASISGDLLQTMASGQMIGATPRRLQISMIFGVITVSAIIGVIVGVLNQAFTIGSQKLPAPQAFLMKGIVQQIFGTTGGSLLPFFIVGAVLAFVLILINLPVLPVAIGIYLPFTLSVPIFIGGVMRYLLDRSLTKRYGSAGEEELTAWEAAIQDTDISEKQKAIRTGLLFTAGLVAGEALMGVVAAVLIVLGLNLAVFADAPAWPGLLLFGYICLMLFYVPYRVLKKKKA